MTTIQFLLVAAMVGEVCFIAGFMTATRRDARRFRESARRRHGRRATEASRFVEAVAPREPIAHIEMARSVPLNDERRMAHSRGAVVPSTAYSRGVSHDAATSVAD